jgi:hypothetical protein
VSGMGQALAGEKAGLGSFHSGRFVRNVKGTRIPGSLIRHERSWADANWSKCVHVR